MNAWNVVERNRMYRFAINEFCESQKIFPLGSFNIVGSNINDFVYVRAI